MNPAAPLEPRAWTPRHWWTMIGVVLLAHFALICFFGARKTPPPRPVANVPILRLAPANDEFIALSDPTLFARPHPHDFASANWPSPPPPNPPSFHWQETPHWLTLSPENLTVTFRQFMATNQTESWTLDFKPAPEFTRPISPVIPALPQESTLRLRGDIAGRTLRHPFLLPDWAAADVIAPSKIQVLVDPVGRVLSAVLLPPDYGLEKALRSASADERALELARSARFSPSGQIAVGQMIFNWHTVPLPADVTPPPPNQP